MTILIDIQGEQPQHTLRCVDWIAIEISAYHCQKYGLRIRSSDSRREDCVGNHRFYLATKAVPAPDESVMHEHPSSAGEGMAILPCDGSARSRSNMSEEQVRAQMTAQVPEILIRPSRTSLPVKSRLWMGAIPAQAETVTVRATRRLQGAQALSD